jgi:hypothetical protein
MSAVFPPKRAACGFIMSKSLVTFVAIPRYGPFQTVDTGWDNYKGRMLLDQVLLNVDESHLVAAKIPNEVCKKYECSFENKKAMKLPRAVIFGYTFSNFNNPLSDLVFRY